MQRLRKQNQRFPTKETAHNYHLPFHTKTAFVYLRILCGVCVCVCVSISFYHFLCFCYCVCMFVCVCVCVSVVSVSVNLCLSVCVCCTYHIHPIKVLRRNWGSKIKPCLDTFGNPSRLSCCGINLGKISFLRVI